MPSVRSEESSAHVRNNSSIAPAIFNSTLPPSSSLHSNWIQRLRSNRYPGGDIGSAVAAGSRLANDCEKESSLFPLFHGRMTRGKNVGISQARSDLLMASLNRNFDSLDDGDAVRSNSNRTPEPLTLKNPFPVQHDHMEAWLPMNGEIDTQMDDKDCSADDQQEMEADSEEVEQPNLKPALGSEIARKFSEPSKIAATSVSAHLQHGQSLRDSCPGHSHSSFSGGVEMSCLEPARKFQLPFVQLEVRLDKPKQTCVDSLTYQQGAASGEGMTREIQLAPVEQDMCGSQFKFHSEDIMWTNQWLPLQNRDILVDQLGQKIIGNLSSKFRASCQGELPFNFSSFSSLLMRQKDPGEGSTMAAEGKDCDAMNAESGRISPRKRPFVDEDDTWKRRKVDDRMDE